MTEETKAPYSRKLRRTIVRLILGLSVIMQVGYIAALPLGNLDPVSRQALLILSVLLASTFAGILALRRLPRAALAFLVVASAICLWWLNRIALWTMAIHILEGRATVTPIAFVSALLASATCLIVPIGFVLALPLRRDGEVSN
ncbi:MAG TPA: hypothetical protein VGO46_10950 [Gemmatimonadaceae bacterium]|jgi:hypothetical protein|nr:hypothetical protein [Gemmatimonadaceae bacterium]